MAKYIITCACGHEVEEQLFGSHKDRAKRVAWREQSDCPKCWKTKKDAAEAAQAVSIDGTYRDRSGREAIIKCLDAEMCEIVSGADVKQATIASIKAAIAAEHITRA